jgi:hypothetical protein
LKKRYVDERIIKKWLEEAENARRIRREMADWNFINSQPPRLREALKYYVETGDIRRACIFAGMDLEDFRDLLRKAKIPVIV